MDLADRRCAPCKEGGAALSEARALELLKGLSGWELVDGRALRKDLLMKDFLAAVRFIEAAAAVAEAEDHHPDLHLTGYRRLRVELSTHAVGGLSENDFILAAKLDGLPRELKPS